MNATSTIASVQACANPTDAPTLSSTSPLDPCCICDTPLTSNDLSLAPPLAYAYGLAQGQCLRCTLEALELLPDAEGMGAAVDMELLGNANTQEDIAFSLVE